MDDGISQLLAYAPMLLGVTLAAPYVVRAHTAHLKGELLVTVLRKLLLAGNGDRALKLTAAAPRAPLCAAAHDALLACRAGAPAREAPGDYRTGAADSSPEAVLARVRVRYDQAFERKMRPVRVARWFAIGAVPLLALSVVSEWVLAPVPLWVAIAAAAALLVLVYTFGVDGRTVRSRDVAFEALRELFYQTALTPGAFDAPALPARPGPAAPARPSLALDVYEPGRERRLVPCDPEVVKIGTISSAHVRLESKGVSRLHAVIERTPDGPAYVIDLGASVPTQVNGEAVTKHELADGDVISIGEAELRVVLGPPAGA